MPRLDKAKVMYEIVNTAVKEVTGTEIGKDPEEIAEIIEHIETKL